MSTSYTHREFKKARDRDIFFMYKFDMRYKTIAYITGLSEHTIKHIVADMKEEFINLNFQRMQTK